MCKHLFLNYIKSIELPKAFLHLIDEGFVLLVFKDNVILEIDDAKEIDQLIVDKLVGDHPFVALVDARDISSSITPEAREFFTNDPLVLQIRKAQALVVNNLSTKLLANFYMKFHKHNSPVKVFSDYTKAEIWVKERRSEWYK